MHGDPLVISRIAYIVAWALDYSRLEMLGAVAESLESLSFTCDRE